jgi:hypothetical protein
MKKIRLGFIICLLMIFTSSCKALDQAIEDTFREPVARKYPKVDENNDKWKKIKDIFVDQSNYSVFVLDIVEDAEDKAGFDFSVSLENDFIDYVNENEIKSYLREEEVFEIIEKIEAENFLLHPDLIKNLIDDLLEKNRREDASLMGGKFYLTADSLSFYIVNPSREDYVDEYIYSLDTKKRKVSPLNEAYYSKDRGTVSIKEIKIESIKKILEIGGNTLKEMGDYRKYDIYRDPQFGIFSVVSELDDGKLIYICPVVGTRKVYDLFFDKDGNLIEKRQR